jgi:hypothetical protein
MACKDRQQRVFVTAAIDLLLRRCGGYYDVDLAVVMQRMVAAVV